MEKNIEQEYIPVLWVPDPHAGIQTTSSYPLPIKSNGIDLTEMTLQGTQTLAGPDVPKLGGCVIAARDDKVTMDL